MSTTRDRWLAFMAERGFSGNVLTQDAVKAAPEFAESEVRLALEPREAAPELAEAEKLIRKDGARSRWLTPVQMRAIPSELDRLRAKLKHLEKFYEQCMAEAAFLENNGEG